MGTLFPSLFSLPTPQTLPVTYQAEFSYQFSHFPTYSNQNVLNFFKNTKLSQKRDMCMFLGLVKQLPTEATIVIASKKQLFLFALLLKVAFLNFLISFFLCLYQH